MSTMIWPLRIMLNPLHHSSVFFIGGELSRHNNTFHQRVALETLQSLNFEKAFIAPESWSHKSPFQLDEYRAAYCGAIINASRKISCWQITKITAATRYIRCSH